MPRYAIRQERALVTLYKDAPDALDAVNMARRDLVDHAQHGELVICRLPDNPDVYDQERDNLLDFPLPDDPSELERPFAGPDAR